LGLIGVSFNSTTELAVSGTIRQKSFAGYTNITYVLRNYIIIANGTNVNIEAGVVIKNEPYSYGITVNGGFKVDGTLANPVIFSSIKDDNVGNPGDTDGDGNGTAPEVGEGPGIYFAPSSDDTYCKLIYLKSYYGGGSYVQPNNNPTTGVIGIESANPVIDQVLLSNLSTTIEGIGVYGSGAPTISNTVFQNGSFFPVSMSLLSNPVFSNITFTSMGYSAILINDDNITSNATLVTRSLAGIANIAYVMNKNLTVNSGATLTISPNVVIKYLVINNRYPYGDYGIVVNGALVVAGTAAKKVVFTNVADDSAGGDSNNDGNVTTPSNSWNGITFNAQSVDSINKIEFADIRFAGYYNYKRASLVFNNAGGTVNQVGISFGYTGLGIFGTANPSFQNMALQNLDVPVRMDMFANPTFGTITANNIKVMGIHIPGSTYSQTGTFPIRNFAGYTNITYVLEDEQTISGGSTITIPAGMSFKGSVYYNGCNIVKGLFTVNGRLNVTGTSANPVVFTNTADDNFGNPADIESNGNATIPSIFNYNDNYCYRYFSCLNFTDIADDSSDINYAVFKYANAGIRCLSSSPTITNCTFLKNDNGIYLSGTATPIVNNNSFVDLVLTPIQTSILTYPSSALNNTISGTTFKGIGILNETLSQDITLPKRNFGGYNNIPYLFGGFTVGTTATLTIAPGVVTKWYGTLNINKGLNALGGLRADSNIIFTSYRDDFYGGDMNSDSTFTTPKPGEWGGIIFNDVSLDPLCKLRNCFIRYATTGITTTNASPDIQKTSFSNFYYDAISANGSSNPAINFCDFYNPSATYFGLNNVNQSFVINAENNWWGNNSGPTHSANPTGTGSKVTNAVDYLPFRTTGPNVPIAGDVSQNGLVQAFDASKILQFLVSAITLTATQQSVGDVSGNNTLSALDASLIMQYATGLINNFPSEAYNRPMDVTQAIFSMAKQSGLPGSSVTIPLTLSNVNRLFGSFAKITFDSTYLQLDTLAFENSDRTVAYNSPVAGTVLFSMAGTTPLNNNTTLAYLHLTIKPNAPAGLTIPLVVEKFQGNEKDLTSVAKNGSVQVLGKIITGATGKQNNLLLSPNPVVKDLKIIIENNLLSSAFTLSVTDMAGQKLIQKSMRLAVNNGADVEINLNTNKLPSGVYILSVQSDKKVISKKFIIAR
jgi:parallel beta-helix repeat protein